MFSLVLLICILIKMQSFKTQIDSIRHPFELSSQQSLLYLKLIQQFYQQIKDELAVNGIQRYVKQVQLLMHALKSNTKFSLLKNKNYRRLIIHYMKVLGIEHCKFSYFNKVKLTQKHLQKLKQIGPILFSQAVMIASKVNIINKNTSRIYVQDHLLYSEQQGPVDIKIQSILRLCDEKKRMVNNNLKKLELILQDDSYVQVIKELGKMLRDSWRKDKIKVKCTDLVQVVPKMHTNCVHLTPSQQLSNADDSNQLSSMQLLKSLSDKISFSYSENQMIMKEFAKIPYKKEESFDKLDKSWSDYDPFDLSISHDFS